MKINTKANENLEFNSDSCYIKGIGGYDGTNPAVERRIQDALMQCTGVKNIMSLTKAEYDALANKDSETIYVVETPALSAGTIVYYDGSKLKFSSPEAWASSLGTPVAVVVVPSTHTPDGTVRAIAVKGVNADGSSATTNVGIKWGPRGTDTGLPNLNTVPTWNNTIGGTVGSNSNAYLPSNKRFTGSTDALDSSLKYYNTMGPFLPNPYLPDGSPNPDYRNTVEATAANACADFDGSGNTAVLVGLGSAYSAANACHLYSAPGIVAGEWYLPAAGELGYMIPRFNQIQSSLSTVGGVQLDASGYYWSSSEDSSDSARTVYTRNGGVSGNGKNSTFYFRAFCSLPVPTPDINLYKGSTPINDTYSKSEIDEMIDNIPEGSPMTEITWSELKSLRDNSQLVPGMQYRITDYITTTTQKDTQSANHQFDIIVTADDVDTLNENARACLHEGDTYFADSMLETWQLKYCLDNDVNRFAWADFSHNNGIVAFGQNYYFSNESKIVQGVEYYEFTTKDDRTGYCTSSSPNIGDVVYEIFGDDYILESGSVEDIFPSHSVNGKGVIYYMKDEFDNECPYDFKNIQFKRYKITSSVKGNLAGKYATLNASNVTVDENTPYWCYTFNTDLLDDASLDGYSNSVYNNVILECPGTTGIKLNNIVFVGSTNYENRFGIYCHDNTFGNYCYDNTFGRDCYNNTFGNNCVRNTFGNTYYNNTSGNTFGGNIFNEASTNNTFGDSCQTNSFGLRFNSNTFEGNVSSNTFGSECHDNTFGDVLYYNTFGHDCMWNNFGGQCNRNIFGNTCSSNKFGNYCQHNSFRNSCTGNTFGDYCKYNSFGNYCSINKFGNYTQESQFGDGVQNFSITTKQMTTAPTSSDLKSYIRWMIVGNGVQYVNAYVTTTTSSSSYCQNLRICSGCSGTSSSRKSFDISSGVGSTVNNVFQPTGSQTVNV